MSSPQNPFEGSAAPLVPGDSSQELPAQQTTFPPAAEPAVPVPSEQLSLVRESGEDPPWTVPEVVALGFAIIFIVFVSMLAVSWIGHRFFAPQVPWVDIARRPEVVVGAQVVAYCGVLVLMYWFAGARGGRPAMTLRWNWPAREALFLLSGVALSLGLQFFARYLPMPKTLPIDQFFETPRQAWLLSIFGITLAPLVEELYFRGFLYPAIARWLNVPSAILLTGLAFGAIHGAQLMYSWAPVLIIVLVGITLSAVRAYSKSVASTVLMHVGYNFAITFFLYFGTDGFRHLDKLKQ